MNKKRNVEMLSCCENGFRYSLQTTPREIKKLIVAKSALLKGASPHSFLKGSLTLETALVLPVFLFAITALLYLYSFTTHMAQKEEAMMASARALSCTTGQYMEADPYIRMTLPEWTKLPYSFIGLRGKLVQSQVVLRAWVGYTGESFSQSKSDQMVFVAEYGTVYHKKRECTYLALSIRKVSPGLLEDQRNLSGERYEACEYCVRGDIQKNVYVTDYGACYHASKECQGLKRTIKMIPITEIDDMRACSKCGY